MLLRACYKWFTAVPLQRKGAMHALLLLSALYQS